MAASALATAGARWRALAPNTRGIVFILGAALTLTAMVGIFKHLLDALPFGVVALFRTTFATIAMLPWVIRTGYGAIRTTRLKTHFIRSFLGITGFVCFIYALGQMLLADATVLSFTMPLWTIVLAAVFLGEKVTPGRIVATLVGFAGVVLVVKPQGGIEPGAALAIVSAILGAAAVTTMKSLTRTEPANRIVFYFFAFGILVTAVPAAFDWQTPTLDQLVWLVLGGVFSVVGQSLLTRAFREGEVSVIMPFDYLRIPFAALIGFLWFAEVPDEWTAAGTLVIVGSSLYVARYQTRPR